MLSFFTLLCGLILEGFKDVVATELEKSARARAHAPASRQSGRLLPQLEGQASLGGPRSAPSAAVCSMGGRKCGSLTARRCSSPALGWRRRRRPQRCNCRGVRLTGPACCLGLSACPSAPNRRPAGAPPPSANNWTTLATGAFHASYALAYVVAALFMLFFLVLLVLQKQVTKELVRRGQAGSRLGLGATDGQTAVLRCLTERLPLQERRP